MLSQDYVGFAYVLAGKDYYRIKSSARGRFFALARMTKKLKISLPCKKGHSL